MLNVFVFDMLLEDLWTEVWNAVMKLWKRLNLLVYWIINAHFLEQAHLNVFVCCDPKEKLLQVLTANLFCSALVTWFHSWSFWHMVSQSYTNISFMLFIGCHILDPSKCYMFITYHQHWWIWWYNQSSTYLTWILNSFHGVWSFLHAFQRPGDIGQAMITPIVAVRDTAGKTYYIIVLHIYYLWYAICCDDIIYDVIYDVMWCYIMLYIYICNN